MRPNILRMAGYAPGEQPRDDGIIKLNTNENPYPPSPNVFEAIRACLTSDRLRKYPEPSGHTFRQKASKVLGIDPDSILIGNGSDDLLTILTRAYVPEGGLIVSPSPSYILYRSLAEIQGARFESAPFTADWKLAQPWPVRGADLTFLANPNSPSGTMVSHEEIRSLAEQTETPVILDEAYVDFANQNGLKLAGKNIIVTRSLSKSYALAGMRFGYAVADPSVIRELLKVKDSYNCDVLSLAAAAAALEDRDYLQRITAAILATRGRLAESLTAFGFQVTPSQANFVWCRRTDRPVKPIYEELKRRKILVRYMNYEGYGDGLRISVGTDAEIDALLRELAGILSWNIPMSRNAKIHRETKETQIDLRLDLDGAGKSEIATGIGFFDHMLTHLAKHGMFDLTVTAKGDLHIDAHHTVEDIGICFGKALVQALGDKAGIRRYGDAMLPMDETLVSSAVDLSGRPFLVWKADVPNETLGTFHSSLAEEFWRAVSSAGLLNLHVVLHHGRNAHHIIEAIFKATARALREAAEIDSRAAGVPSTKGVLS